MNDKSELDYFEVFPWNKNFETGHREIDGQHRNLVSLLNELANTLVYDETFEVSQAFDALAEYANYHFEAEEAVWREFLEEDEWAQIHQKTHASFIPKVLELKEKDADKPLPEVIEDIVKFLIRWLAFHIIDDDKRLAVVVAERKKGKSLEEAKAAADEVMGGSIRVLIETVLSMYDGLSSRTLSLMRERNARIKAEEQLRQANKKLEELSITDQLTGLHNRRHFEDVCTSELKRARRDQHALILLLFDIDYFKRLNDQYGHGQGDEALQAVGKRLKEICRRPSDFCFRVGGEEFAVVASGDPHENGEKLAEIVRREIQALAIPNKHSDVADVMTVSVGVVASTPNGDETVEDLLRQADSCLYEAKNLGRNQVVAAPVKVPGE